VVNKIVDSLQAALAGVQDGATVLVGGFGGAGIARELIDALIAQGARDLTHRQQQCRQRRDRAGRAAQGRPGEKTHLLLSAPGRFACV
jgi:acyl CoA:acetate/3-ketoacid CoA transferase alpha subunit